MPVPSGDPAFCSPLLPGEPQRRARLPAVALTMALTLVVLWVLAVAEVTSASFSRPQSLTQPMQLVTALSPPLRPQAPLQPPAVPAAAPREALPTPRTSALLRPALTAGWPGAALAAGATALALVLAVVLHARAVLRRPAPTWAVVSMASAEPAMDPLDPGRAGPNPGLLVAEWDSDDAEAAATGGDWFADATADADVGEGSVVAEAEEDEYEGYPEETFEAYAAKRRQVQERAREVIRVCDPLWKLGYIADCERHYRRLYNTLMREEEVTMDPTVYRVLVNSLKRCHPDTGHRNCVLLRGGLERVIGMPLEDEEWNRDPWQPQPFELLVANNDTAPVARLLDLAKPIQGKRAITDRVRMGDSLVNLSVLPDKQCSMFEGVLGSATGGAFSSVWLPTPKGDFSRYAGFYIDCCVPKEFKDTVFLFGVMPEDWARPKVSIVSGFQAPVGKFGRVLIPRAYFGKPTRFGKPVKVPYMDWRRVHRVGLLVMRPFLGPFRLYVRDIGLYQ